jgi:6-phosphogluconate dehydrogenase
MRKGHTCVVHDRSAEAVSKYVAKGAGGANTIDEFVSKLTKPRAAWVMVPAGGPTESTVQELGKRFEAGDIIIDGGNSFYKDDIRRAQSLAERGIHYLDVGTSGGIWGLERGFCLMAGGERQVFEQAEPLLRALAPGGADGVPRAEQGYIYCGPSGAGHFVKMVHNGIEYGLMQAYAEGFDILHKAGSPDLPANSRYELNLADIAEVWRHGSVINSWLLDLIALALDDDAELEGFTGFVEDSGEGRWTLMAAIEEAVPAAVLSAALYARFRSRETNSYADKLLSAMRNRFGGHLEPKKK